MFVFLINCIFWTLAIYGLIDLIKMGINHVKYKRIESNGLYVIIAAKNQEVQIEGFLRSVVFRVLYGKENCVSNVLVTDLDSVDNTKLIMEKMSDDYNEIKVVNWEDCKRMLDNLE